MFLNLIDKKLFENGFPPTQANTENRRPLFSYSRAFSVDTENQK